jgi:hypothetical protein
VYLKGLLSLLHYADHVEANLLDARGLLANTLSVVTAGGAASVRDRDRVVHSADTAYAALRDVHEAVDQVVPDRTVLRRMRVDSWRKALEELRLPAPSAANIAPWLNAIDGWMQSALASLASLRLAALEQLLAAEAQVARFLRERLQPAEAPPASLVPKSYRLMLPGTERPRAAQLDWWERFQTGGGVLPTLVRVAAAVAIIAVVLMVGHGAALS